MRLCCRAEIVLYGFGPQLTWVKVNDETQERESFEEGRKLMEKELGESIETIK